MFLRRLFGSRRRDDEQPPAPEQVAHFNTPDEGDRLILDELRSLGADLSQPREVLHYLYVPTEAAATEASQEARDQGYTTEIRPAGGQAGPHPWLVLANQDVVLSYGAARFYREVSTQI